MSSYRSSYGTWNTGDTNKTNTQNTTGTKNKTSNETPPTKKYDSSYLRNRYESPSTKDSVRSSTITDKNPTSRYSSLGSSSFRSSYSSPSSFSRDKTTNKEKDTPASTTSTSNRYTNSYSTEEKPERQSTLSKYVSSKSDSKTSNLPSSTYSRLTDTSTKSRSRDPSPPSKTYSYTRTLTNLSNKSYDDTDNKHKDLPSNREKIHESNTSEREKDIPIKKTSYSTSSYPSFKLYQRPSSYTRSSVTEEKKTDSSTNTPRYTSRFGCSYTRSSIIDKPISPYVSSNSLTNNSCETKVKENVVENNTSKSSDTIVKPEISKASVNLNNVSNKNEEDTDSEEESSDSEVQSMISITVVTRGTSPTPPSSSIYLRTRRADMAKTIEKTVTRSKVKPEMVDKDMQSDRLDDTTRTSRYGGTSRISATPWPTYVESRYSSSLSSGRYTSGRYTSSYTPRDSAISSTSAEKNNSSSENSYSKKLESESCQNTVSNLNKIDSDTKLLSKNVPIDVQPSPKIEKEVSVSACRESPIKINKIPLSVSANNIKSDPMIVNCNNIVENETFKREVEKSKSSSPCPMSPVEKINNIQQCIDQLPPQVPKPDQSASVKSSPSPHTVNNKDAKFTGKKIVKKIKVKSKDGEPKTRKLKKSVSTSSGDSETSLQNGDCENDVNGTKKNNKTVSKIKIRGSLAKNKTNREGSSETSSDSSNRNSQTRSLSLSRTNSTETNSLSSSTSTSDVENDETKLQSLELKTQQNEIKVDRSSRTSNLASSADDISLPLDKSFRHSPSPKSIKNDSQPRTEEAKSFLMRALAPVTNLFKLHKESGDKSHTPENTCDSDNLNTLNVPSIATDVESKSSNIPKIIRHIESGERAWWLDSSSESKKASQSSPKSPIIHEENNNIENNVTTNGYKLSFSKPDSDGKPWWQDSKANIPEGIEIRTPSRKGSSESDSSDKYNVYKINNNDSSEKDWWNKINNNETSNSLDSGKTKSSTQNSKKDDKFTLNVVKIKHIESGERAWWLCSNKNIPEGVEKLSTSSDNSDSECSDAQNDEKPTKETMCNGLNQLEVFSNELTEDEFEEPLGDRKSPEGLETPHDGEDCTGRTSPYDNVPCNHTTKQKSTMNNVPHFISRHMDIDDILGTSGQLFSPTMNRILSRKTGREIVEGDNSECREINPGQVRIHDSTAKMPVIQKLRSRSDIIDCRNEDDSIDLDDSALQVYKDGDYGPYLDLESSLNEQQEDLEGFHKNRKNYIVLRTQLSVRVHAIREKLLNSDGRELRRALFSLKQIFQDDKDLVHEFVQNDGLDCLIRVGSGADQYYQNYILRALGQVMLYVDGMNGVMKHNASLQWLYSLIASKFRLVVKTTLKLLLVFVEYVDTNCMLLIKAIEAVDCNQGLRPWTNIMNLLKDYDASDTELLIYAMTLINNCLNGIPDQETYYDQTDCLEDQGICSIIQRYMSKPGTDLDLLRQFQIYEAVLSHEDGDDKGTPPRQLDDSIRQKLRHRKLVEESKQGRKSRRHYASLNTRTTNGPCDTMARYNHTLLQSQLADEEDEPLSPQPSKTPDVFRDSQEVALSLQRRRDRAHRQREFIKEQQKLSSLNKKDESIEIPTNNLGIPLYTSGLQQRIQNGTLGHTGPKDLTLAVNNINKQMDEMELHESPKANGKSELIWKKKYQNGECYEDDKILNDDPLNLKKPMLMIDKESTVKDITEKLCSPCSIRNQMEEGRVNLVENMTGVISKAMKGLAKSKSKSIVRSPTIEINNKGDVKKNESDFSWESIIASLDRPLRLKDLDFTDLSEGSDEQTSKVSKSEGWVPPPPPLVLSNNYTKDTVPPPPPNCPQFTVPLAPISQENSTTLSPEYHNKSKKTIKLFWREINDVRKPTIGSLWDEIVPVKIESKILEHLFESRTKDVIKQLEINKNKEVIVLDHKRSNAINILLKKLPPPQAIKNAIIKMDATVLTREGIDKLIAMLPSEEETVKIQEAQVANPSIPLGNAEQFLLTLSSISELNARLKLWVFKLDFESIENEIAEPYMDFKLAMEILRKNHTFKKIISAILSTGNFLNSSDAKGFQVEYLSKIHEVKDTVHKHSLLHHLCHIILDQFPETTDLYSEIGPVTRASKVNFEELSANIERLEIDCKASTNYLKEILKHDGNLMKAKLGDFLHDCAERIVILSIIKKRLYHRYTEFLLWLGIPPHRISETRPSDIFKVISEFALEYRTTRERVLEQRARKACHRERNKTRGKMIMDVGILLGPETAENQLNTILTTQDSNTRVVLNRKRKDPENVDKKHTTNNNQVGGIEEVFNSMLTSKISSEKKSDHHTKRHTKLQKGSIKRSRTREGIHNDLRLGASQ